MLICINVAVMVVSKKSGHLADRWTRFVQVNFVNIVYERMGVMTVELDWYEKCV
jgi:hypothetical protein